MKMTLSSSVLQVCLFLAAVCGFTLSQAPGADQSLFNLMNPQPATTGLGGTGMDMGAMGAMGGMGSLDSILGMGPTNSFSPATGTNNQAPNPSFPTLGGGIPVGASQSQANNNNPMSNFLPLMLFSGMDMSKWMMMMLFGGMGMGGGGMGGMGMLPMLGLMNNM